MSESYYAATLAAERLKRCYELATPAVRRFLDAESEYARRRIAPGERVIELGCGYGRVLEDLGVPDGGHLVGVDISLASLRLARGNLGRASDADLVQMDCAALAFADASFDVVCCIQNGISAFHVDQRMLVREAVRIARPGGRVLFSSYADEFWPERLEWFRIQSAHGLVGEIDEAATGDGEIVCLDGFTATTVRPRDFAALTAEIDGKVTTETVNGCSVFCVIEIPGTIGEGAR